MFADDEARLLLQAASDAAALERLVARRVTGEPLEHLLGWAEFCGLRVGVGPGVFVPRRRTELLVAEAAALAHPGDVVVDLCAGSGAVGLALATGLGRVELHAVELDPVAAGYARANLHPVGGTVHVGDLFTPLPDALRGAVRVVVVNAPYVPTDALAGMPAEARDHEPRRALDGGADGLALHRRIAADSGPWLVPGGHVVIETSVAQCDATRAAFAAAGFATRVARDDDRDGTAVIATRAATTQA